MVALSRGVLASGLVAFAWTCAAYTSYEPTYLNRWSAEWVVILLAISVASVWTVSRFVRRGPSDPGLAPGFVLLGVGVWTLTYSWECWQRSDTRLAAEWTEGTFFIANTVPGVAGEWIVLTLLSCGVFVAAWNALSERDQRPIWQIGKRLVVLFGSFAFALLLVEGGLRLRNLLLPQPQGMPTQAGDIFKWRYYTYNQDGYRDHEVPKQKPPNTTRILAIGDSITEGVGIRSPSQRFTGVLEKQLNRASGDHVFQVVNLGRGNTHTIDHIEALKASLVYQPDLVLLMYVFNDIEHVAPGGSRHVPFRPLGDFDPRRLVLVNSHLGMEVLARWSQFQASRSADEDEMETSPYRRPSILAAHLDALETFFDLCARHDVPAVLVPFDISFTAVPAAANRNRHFYEVISRRGIDVWPMDSLFAGKPFSDLRVASLDGHPGVEAHRAVGLELAERVPGLLKNVAGERRSGRWHSPR